MNANQRNQALLGFFIEESVIREIDTWKTKEELASFLKDLWYSLLEYYYQEEDRDTKKRFYNRIVRVALDGTEIKRAIPEDATFYTTVETYIGGQE